MVHHNSGKTRIATEIVNLALEKGKRAMFVVPAIELIDQTVEAFRHEGLDTVGVIQANHPLTNPMMPVQVASVQTLMRRGAPDVDLVLIDECHRMFKFYRDWMDSDEWSKVPFIGLSATPWARGMRDLWDDLIIASTTRQMISEGWLCDFEVYAPSHPDLTGVKTVAGDYHEGELADAMERNNLTADIVSTWLQKAPGLPTLCFGVNRKHAQSIQDEFEKAGVRCGYVDGNTSAEDRAEIREAFHAGYFSVVANVGVLTTGVDWDVRCLILARPTKSEMLFTQIIGRALRTAEGKPRAVILDHSDSHLRLGMVTDIHYTSLRGGKPDEAGDSGDRAKPERLPKECDECSFLKPAGVRQCPKCGHSPAVWSDIETEDGELVRYGGGKVKGPKQKQYTSEEKLEFYQGLIWVALDRGRKRGWAFHAYKKKFGVNPIWSGNRTQPAKPSFEVLDWAKHCDMAYAKSRKAN